MKNYAYYEECWKRIDKILNSKTKVEELSEIPGPAEFTYENGIKSWMGALSVDIKDSTAYFKNEKSEIVARVMRAFCSEIVAILSENPHYRQIGIRGDCVYAIYSCPHKGAIKSILIDACRVVTFNIILQEKLKRMKFPSFEIGVGLGASEGLIIKAGKKGAGISDVIWIGDAVVDAAKLSSQCNRDLNASIAADEIFYSNIMDLKANEECNFSCYFQESYSRKINAAAYLASLRLDDIDDWIKERE